MERKKPLSIFGTFIFAALFTVSWSTKCGDISYTGMTPTEAVHRGNKFVFPWDALLKWKFRTTPICLATIVQTDQWGTRFNSTNRVVTAAHCFRRKMFTRMLTLDSFQVLVGFDYDAKPPQAGRPYGIRSKKELQQLFGTRRTRQGIAVLELNEPIVFTRNVRPVCMPKRGEKLPNDPVCFMPVYQKDEKRIKEVQAPLANDIICALRYGELRAARGFCLIHPKKRSLRKLGSPLICLAREKFVQFGVYTAELKANYKNMQKGTRIGYANDITLLTSMIAGKRHGPTVGKSSANHPAARIEFPTGY